MTTNRVLIEDSDENGFVPAGSLAVVFETTRDAEAFSRLGQVVMMLAHDFWHGEPVAFVSKRGPATGRLWYHLGLWRSIDREFPEDTFASRGPERLMSLRDGEEAFAGLATVSAVGLGPWLSTTANNSDLAVFVSAETVVHRQDVADSLALALLPTRGFAEAWRNLTRILLLEECLVLRSHGGFDDPTVSVLVTADLGRMSTLLLWLRSEENMAQLVAHGWTLEHDTAKDR